MFVCIVTEDFCPSVCHHKLQCNCSKLLVIHYWRLLWGRGAYHGNYICKYGMGYVLVALIFSKAANKKKITIQTTAWLQIWNPLDQLVAEEGTFGSIFGVIIKSASYIYCSQLNLMPLTQSVWLQVCMCTGRENIYPLFACRNTAG